MTTIFITPAQRDKIADNFECLYANLDLSEWDGKAIDEFRATLTLLRSLEPQEPCAWKTEWISRGPQRGLEFWEPEAMPGRKITPLYAKEPT